MKEAHVKCLCSEFRLPDVIVRGKPLVMTRGQEEWLTTAQVRGSKDLARAQRIGAVSVEWRERFKVAKSPRPPWLRGKGQRKMTRLQPTATPAPTPPAPPVVDTEEIAQRAEAAAAKAATAAMDKGIGEIKALLAGQSTGIPQAQLEAALRNVLPGMTLPAGRPAGASVVDGPDEPMFIPKDIVGKDTEANISIEAEASKSAGLDAAAAALAAAKPKTKTPRKRRSRKKAEETD
jgi:hypothetical protein